MVRIDYATRRFGKKGMRIGAPDRGRSLPRARNALAGGDVNGTSETHDQQDIVSEGPRSLHGPESWLG